MLRLLSMALFACLSQLTAQPPAIGQNGVVNMASQIPPTLAGGALAPGSLFTIYGVRFGSETQATRVMLQCGRRTIAAKVVSVQPKRIDAWLPESVPVGSAVLKVERSGQTTEGFTVQVDRSNGGLFSRNGEGWGPGLIQNLRPNGAAVDNTPSTPAHPGDRVKLLGTGLSHTRSTTLVVGGRVVMAGPTHAAAQLGQDEISFTIPRDAPNGCYVPLYALAAPGRASNVVTVAIRAGEGPCNPGPLNLSLNGRMGIGVLARSRMRARSANVDKVSDEAVITFTAHGKRPLLSPLLLLPPPGACTAYTSSFQAETILPNSISAAIVAEVEAKGLSAGRALTLTKGMERRTVPEDGGASGYYRAQIGSSDRRGPGALILDPGEFTLSGAGGSDVGPFSLKAIAAEPFEWTDRENLSQVDRGRALKVHWSGLTPDRMVLILATNVDQITTAIGTVLCAAPAGDGKFTIPGALLANLPASKAIPGVPYDQLFLVSIPAKSAPAIPASGLDGGAMVSLYAIGRIVEYR